MCIQSRRTLLLAIASTFKSILLIKKRSYNLHLNETGVAASEIRHDEGLTLETSAFQIFQAGNSTFINSFDKTKF